MERTVKFNGWNGNDIVKDVIPLPDGTWTPSLIAGEEGLFYTEGLMQYTGFNYRNGTEAFEGDIIMPGKGVIFFDNGSFQIKWHDKMWKFQRGESEPMHHFLNFSIAFEKGGNIYTHPELLTKTIK